MSNSAKWYLVVAVVGLALLIAFLPGLLSGQQDQEAGAGGDDGASISNVEARPDCVDGDLAGVELPCLGGEPTTATRAEITVVNLWAWWCEPCRDELPILDAFAEAHPDYDVVGVHADANARNGAAMLNELGVDMPSYQDDSNRFAGTLGLPSVVPITLVLDGSGERLATFPQPFTSLEELEAAVAGAVAS